MWQKILVCHMPSPRPSPDISLALMNGAVPPVSALLSSGQASTHFCAWKISSELWELILPESGRGSQLTPQGQTSTSRVWELVDTCSSLLYFEQMVLGRHFVFLRDPSGSEPSLPAAVTSITYIFRLFLSQCHSMP